MMPFPLSLAKVGPWMVVSSSGYSEYDDELDKGEAGTSGESTVALDGFGGVAVKELGLSSSFGLCRFGRLTGRLDCACEGVC